MSELEAASFDVERFALGADACLEVHGRWSGVRGRRFMRPALTAVTGDREHRLLAVLDHKPWAVEEGEPWQAAFPWSADPAGVREAELTVAPDVTVSLPPPSSPEGGRRGRSGQRRSRRHDATDANGGSASQDGGQGKAYEAASRSLVEAHAELQGVKRDRDRLRLELAEALAAREAVIAERHDVIEREVRLRIADLRAETERERAAAGQAAQSGRERDNARAERTEALGERDEALAERDAARLERNRMLAQRDTARSRAEDAVRRWESTAALGTRRTQQRDAALSERDRVARNRDEARAECDRLAAERDVAQEEREGVARERDAALEQLERAREQIEAPTETAGTPLEIEGGTAPAETMGVAGQPQTARSRGTFATSSGSARADRSARQTRGPIANDGPVAPRRPPAPRETRRRATAVRGGDSRPSARGFGTNDAAEMWRARLLAVAALLLALLVFVVIVTAK